jgi:hypothetical protein
VPTGSRRPRSPVVCAHIEQGQIGIVIDNATTVEGIISTIEGWSPALPDRHFWPLRKLNSVPSGMGSQQVAGCATEVSVKVAWQGEQVF